MSDLKIAVDPVGQLRLFRTSTFADPYTFIAEAMQNAQRAGATEVNMKFTSKQAVITDNGKGLSNPESLFTIAKTGWDEDTQKSEDPFGIGFFSSLVMANTVTVNSGKRYFRFNFDKLASGDLEVESGDLEEEVVGFKVILTDMVPSYDYWTAKARAKDIASTIPSIKTTVNDIEVDTFDFTIPPSGSYKAVNIPHKVRGWISLAEFSWENDIKVYHKGRFVRKLSISGFTGALEVELTAVNLRAPDRRDFIMDDLYKEFVATLTNKFIKPFLVSLTSSQVNRYQVSTINQYLCPADYADQLRYIKLTDELIIDRASQMDEDKLNNMDFNDINELFSGSIKEPEAVRFDDVDLFHSSPESFIPDSERHEFYSGSSSSGAPLSEQTIEEEDLKALSGMEARYLRRTKRVYYAEPIDLKRKRDLLKELVASGQTVVIGRNELEIKALKEVLSAIYIGAADVSIENKFIVSNREPSAKYNRVQALLKVLFSSTPEFAKLDLSIAPGSISVVRSRVLEDLILSKDQKYPAFYVNDKVLVVDTTKLKHSKVLNIRDSRADLGELLYLLDNIEDLSDCTGVSAYRICQALSALRISWIVTQSLNEEAEVCE